MDEVLESLPKPVQENVKDLRILWPYLSFMERMDWIDKMRGAHTTLGALRMAEFMQLIDPK